MPKDFYYQVMGETFGPLTGVKLREAALNGIVAPETLVRVGTEGHWVLATLLKGLFDESGHPIRTPDVIHHPSIETSAHTSVPAHEQVRESDFRAIPDVSNGRDPATPLITTTALGLKSARPDGGGTAMPEDQKAFRPRQYLMLKIYSGICGVLGALGLFATGISIMTAFRLSGPAVDAALVWCLSLGLGSLGLLAFSEGIQAFTHLLQDTSQSTHLLKRMISLLQHADTEEPVDR